MRTLYCLICFCFAVSLTGQIEPPDFLCTSFAAGNEVLSWENTSSACGPYVATEIYVARGSAAGPYALLVTLTDANATEFVDPNPAGELRYYFLRYRYDCPGEAVVNSDTLDNLIPATPPISYVSVEDDEIILTWTAELASPEVDRYRIFLVNATTTTLLDSVLAPTTIYRFPLAPGADPTEFTLRIAAVDACGNDGPLSRAVRPMELGLGGGTGCVETIQVFPDQEAIATYLPLSHVELFVSVLGQGFVSAGTFPPNADSIPFRDANDGELRCFYLEGVLPLDGGRVRSTINCLEVDFSQPVRDFPLYGVSFGVDGSLTATYAEVGSAPVITESLLRVNRGGEVTSIALTEPVYNGTGTLALPLPAGELRTGETLSIRLADECGREVTTNEVEPVYLQVSSLLAGQNALSWSPLINNLDGTTTYNVLRATVADAGAAAGAMFMPIATGQNALSFTDDQVGPEGVSCYRVEAVFSPVDGSGPFSFLSPIACVAVPVEVYLPNALSPRSVESVNQTFRPFFSSLPPAEGYELLVFDRWGGLIFRSNDPGAAWDGSHNGQPLAAGTYLYQLTYRSSQGFQQRTAGTVNLIR